jgi:glutathione S-transferase
MNFVSVVAVLALIEYMVIGLQTGRARQTYGVKAPATTGDPMFERYYRVQHNTLEQLVIFLPALFLFARYVSPVVAGLLGLVFIAGRALYARGYIADPQMRGPGFLVSFSANALLVLGALIGALLG